MAATNLATDLKNVSEKDRKQIEQAQEMLGPDPAKMGLVKIILGQLPRERGVSISRTCRR